MRVQLTSCLAWVAWLTLMGCAAEVGEAIPSELDACGFEAEVYPQLARDCGFPTCHGNDQRFFQVWAPGRARLDESTGILAAPTRAELDRSYERALSMLGSYGGAGTPEDSLLLRKPLEASAGGAAHRGVDRLGRDVYPSTDDPGWQRIAQWARGEVSCP
ncbi:MAG: hypothetical protein H6721_07250 [Sandaracinus sp.]|nr:hypothetical protein [Sandaracinus sp.]